MNAYEDPNNPGNSQAHHTGKRCIEAGCGNPAGTAWSHLWCQSCNAARMRRIDNSLRGMLADMATRNTPSNDRAAATQAAATEEPKRDAASCRLGSRRARG